MNVAGYLVAGFLLGEKSRVGGCIRSAAVLACSSPLCLFSRLRKFYMMANDGIANLQKKLYRKSHFFLLCENDVPLSSPSDLAIAFQKGVYSRSLFGVCSGFARGSIAPL